MAVAIGLGALLCGVATAQAQPKGVSEPEISRFTGPSVTIAILPTGTEPTDLEGIEGLSPGALSAGLSNVSAIQSYLDITQGNRVFTSLYDEGPPDIFGLARGAVQVPGWDIVLHRADSAPAEIAPGLFASTLEDGAVPFTADSTLTSPALIAANREGVIDRSPAFRCLERKCVGASVVPTTLGRLPQMIERLAGDDLLIAFERPPTESRETLAIGVAGRGFGDGNLTSDTTRTPGFVLSTDIAPTVLDRVGLDIPDEMSGQPIEAEGETDAADVQDRADRMEVVSDRRKNVIVRNLMAWFALAALVALASRGRFARPAMAAYGLSVVYLPTLLLAGAAADTTELGERLIVGLGAPLLAILTILLAPGWAGMAVACGVSIAAYAIDVIVGSPLTARSLLGPNPGLGVRFFGIGNELESSLAVMIPVGVGAGLTAWARNRAGPESGSPGSWASALSVRTAAGAFIAAGALFALIFAAGRFGADVGAAIVFPAGAAVAAVCVPGALRRRKLLLLLLAAPVAGLAVLFLVDLVLGGDAHLSRSVFEAGGSDELADVFERRLRLSAASFGRATGQNLFWFSVAALVVAGIFRGRILAWFEGAPLARAGYAGALAAVLLGVVANDSGATFLIIGTIGLLGCLAFAWAQTPENMRKSTDSGTN